MFIEKRREDKRTRFQEVFKTIQNSQRLQKLLSEFIGLYLWYLDLRGRRVHSSYLSVQDTSSLLVCVWLFFYFLYLFFLHFLLAPTTHPSATIFLIVFECSCKMGSLFCIDEILISETDTLLYVSFFCYFFFHFTLCF